MPGLAVVLAAAAVLVGYSALAAWRGPLLGAAVLEKYVTTPAHLNPHLNLLGAALFVVAAGAALASGAYRRLSSPWLPVAVQVTACSVLLSAAAGGTLGDVAGTAAAVAPALAAGQVIWLVHARRVPLWGGAGLGLAAWVVFCWGQRLGYDLGQSHNTFTLVVAGSAVAIALLARSSGTAAPTPAGGRFAFLDIFRAVAAPLVVYSHVAGKWLASQGLGDTPVVQFVDTTFRAPLELQQHLGFFGVVVFFLVSGFIVTHVATGESHREFAVKRVLRIYPLLVVAVLVSAAVGMIGQHVLDTGQQYAVTPQVVLTNALLVNYFLVPQLVLVGVAWSLAVEIVFYIAVLVLLPLLRRRAWIALAIELELVFLAILLARSLGPNFFLLSITMSFLPVLLIGQAVWAVWSGRLPLWAGALFAATSWALYVWAGNRSMGRLDDGYDSAVLLGTLLFLVALLVERRLRRTAVVSFLADRSYSIYLLHGLIALPVMDVLYPALPAGLCVLAGLGVTMAAVEVTYRWVELPGQRLARRITRRHRLPAATTAGPSHPDPLLAPVNAADASPARRR